MVQVQSQVLETVHLVNEEAMEKKIREAVPSVRIQWSQDEVALLILATPEEQAQEVETKLAIAQRAWKWKSALRKPQRLLSMLHSLCLQRQQSSPTEPLMRQMACSFAFFSCSSFSCRSCCCLEEYKGFTLVIF